ncbi:MAG TPA: hypothetical protein VNK24_10535 [Elusimicrobiota bacterium]|nr:hypothetical protein [Elusimicrobiota bacterium]
MNLPKPDIRPDVNKAEKKSSGFWSGLFSLLSRNPVVMEGGEDAASAAGGEGLLQSLSRLGFGSGILATKAGVIAVALAGGSLAGGVGYMGYKAMRQAPGAAGVHSFWPFAAPPSSSAGAAGAAGQASGAGAAAGGGRAQDSLASLRAANPAAARAALASNAAGAKAGAAGGGAAGGAGAHGIPTLNDNGFKSGDWRIGGGGGGGTFAASKGAPSAGRKAASVGSLAGTSRSLADLAKSGMRGLGLGGAVGQARQVNGEMTNPGYGGGASRYDTAGTSGGGTPIGGAGAGASLGGAGTGSGAGNANAPTNGGSNNQQYGAPPTPTAGSSAAPWQGMLNEAMLMAFLAALLIFIANKVKDIAGYGETLAMVLAGLAALLGIIEITLGAAIGGQGQQAVGSMFTLSGGLIAASAVAMIFSQSASGDTQTLLQNITKYAGVGAVVAAMGAYMQGGGMSGTGGSGSLGGYASITPPSAQVVVIEAAPSERIG